MTRPFCIKCHVDMCLDASIAFVKTNRKTIFITPNLPPICMATKTNSIATRLVTKFFITVGCTTKNFPSPILWWPNCFNGHSCVDQKTFNHQFYGDQKLFVFNPKFFISNPMVTKCFFANHVATEFFFNHHT